MVDRIKERLRDDPELVKFSKKVEEANGQEFSLKNSVLRFRDHLCVPDITELKELPKEPHHSTRATHHGSTKMY